MTKTQYTRLTKAAEELAQVCADMTYRDTTPQTSSGLASITEGHGSRSVKLQLLRIANLADALGELAGPLRAVIATGVDGITKGTLDAATRVTKPTSASERFRLALASAILDTVKNKNGQSMGLGARWLKEEE